MPQKIRLLGASNRVRYGRSSVSCLWFSISFSQWRASNKIVFTKSNGATEKITSRVTFGSDSQVTLQTHAAVIAADFHPDQ
jgi:hypothetical protein